MSAGGENLVLFPTIAHQHKASGTWSADVHGWCFDGADDFHFQRTAASFLRRALKIDRNQPDPPFFRERAGGFVVENRKKVVIEVAYDRTNLLAVKTKRNGHFQTKINLTISDDSPMATTTFGAKKVSLTAIRKDCQIDQVGGCYLIPDQGLSIISDIDDTIKFSNVGNREELLANTFLRPFRPIEGMPELFNHLAAPERSFHYISATPWQMVRSVSQFLSEHNFPEGSVHLRKFALKDVTFLKKIFPAYKKKRKVVEDMMFRFPNRRFLLFGDTGEKDPEIYGDIARRFPDQTLGICLRNVSPDLPGSIRFRKAFTNVSPRKWIIFEDVLRLESQFLPEMLGTYQNQIDNN
ncbi:phosphatidate phosphatase App1 family protein [Rubinisphaera italica]|uniref:Phosphatidate phosphatase APP1 catalytic domain-containing protein n=1 Tax=Rubinisphaera italica TaxID=2527969 RepID=A0A5C5XCA4_9PLAN|nr:App1 family protein [Rubinisphaera italica]TWT60229.1 hypothetical protein Pan54_09430 [Rubinisphaera italica]